MTQVFFTAATRTTFTPPGAAAFGAGSEAGTGVGFTKSRSGPVAATAVPGATDWGSMGSPGRGIAVTLDIGRGALLVPTIGVVAVAAGMGAALAGACATG